MRELPHEADEDLNEPESGSGEPSGNGALAALIAREMGQQGLTLDMLARRSGLAIATIAALRSGTRGKRPRPATLQRLAVGLGVDEADIAAAASVVQPLQQTAREATLLNLFRQLHPSDQLLAERILNEIVRSTARGDIEPSQE